MTSEVRDVRSARLGLEASWGLPELKRFCPQASVRGHVLLFLPRSRPVSSVTVTLSVLVDLSITGNQIEHFKLWTE